MTDADADAWLVLMSPRDLEHLRLVGIPPNAPAAVIAVELRDYRKPITIPKRRKPPTRKP